jgi:hypothetical protein
MSVSATPSDQEVPALVPSSSTRDHLARFFSSRLYIVIISCVLLINIVLLGWVRIGISVAAVLGETFSPRPCSNMRSLVQPKCS